MAAAYPPGGTFFETVKKSFVDVPVDESKDNAISTNEFLEAAESTTTLFDVLGSVAFKPVKNDMSGNIKVRTSIDATATAILTQGRKSATDSSQHPPSQNRSKSLP